MALTLSELRKFLGTTGGALMNRIAMFGCFAAGLLVGCRAEPTFHGESLLCENDTDCPTAMRCVNNGCVYNSPPVVGAIVPLRQLVGQPVSTTAHASDPDAADQSALVLTWEQVSGIPLTPPIASGATLSVTPTAVGVYVFQVSATDPRGAVGSTTFTLTASNPTTDVYVADNSDADPNTCGDFDKPCRTIDAAMTALANRNASRVLLAAPTGAEPYRTCLNVDGNIHLLGCFDPVNWLPHPNGPAACRILCDISLQTTDTILSHVIEQSGRVEDVTLATSEAEVTTPTGTAELPAYTTVVTRNSAQLINTDVELPLCADCLSVGLVGIELTPPATGANIDRVEVHGAISSVLGNRALIIGMGLVEGAPIIAGGPLPRLANDTGRGGVFLNVPANLGAIGITLAQTAAQINGISIRGGLAPALSGIQVFGGPDLTSPNVDDANQIFGNVINLSGFGTRSIVGVSAQYCENNDENCQCVEALQTCLANEPPYRSYPNVSVFNNAIDITAGTTALGLTPCFGIAISGDSSRGTSTIGENQIHVGEQITQAMGILMTADESVSPIGSATSITQNSIQIGSAQTDPVCVALNELSGGDSINAGAGIAILNGTNYRVEENTIHVGANDLVSVGLFALTTENSNVDHNTILVAEPLTSDTVSDIETQNALGAALGSVTGTTDSKFSRNWVAVGNAAVNSTGLILEAPQAWSVSNNFIFGGYGRRTVGMKTSDVVSDPSYPKVIHNTIVAGGKVDHTFTSRAISISITGTFPGGNGFFRNNLLDAGNAAGQRYLVDDFRGPIFDLGATSVGNVSQFYGPSANPQVTRVFFVRSLLDDTSGTQFLALRPNAVLHNAAEIATFQRFATAALPPSGIFEETSRTPTPVKPNVIAMGDLGVGNPGLLVGMVGQLALAQPREFVGDFTFWPTNTKLSNGQIVDLTASAVAIADADNGNPNDLLFIENESFEATRQGGIWYLAANRSGSGTFEKPARLKNVYFGIAQQPEMLAASSSGDASFVVAKVFNNDTLIEAPSGLAWNLGNIVGAGNSCLSMVADSLGDAGTVFPSPTVVMLCETGTNPPIRLLAWRELNFSSPPGGPLTSPPDIPSETNLSAPPCETPGDFPVAVATANVLSGASHIGKELIVGCQSGTISIYEAGAVIANLVRVVSFNAGAIALSFDGDTDGVESYLLVGMQNNRLRIYRSTDLLGAVDPPPPISEKILQGDLWRWGNGDWQQNFTPAYGMTGFAATAPDHCHLQFREPDTDSTDFPDQNTFDLHLLDDDVICRNQGDPTNLANFVDDRDGLGTRTDGNLDIGADER